jgi:hypothetical protein
MESMKFTERHEVKGETWFIIEFILVDMDNVADILEIHDASMFPPTLKMKYIPPKLREHSYIHTVQTSTLKLRQGLRSEI